MNSRSIAWTIGLVSFGLSLTAQATLLYSDFSSTAGLTLNGTATTLDNGIDPNPVLRLANTMPSNGSAYTNSTIDITSFTSSFRFRITEPGGIRDASGQIGADGIAFVIQPIGPTSLGDGGGYLGYRGISPSVAVELDTFYNEAATYPDISDPDTNHIGIDTNGSLLSLTTAPAPGQFDDGTRRSMSITYDGTTLTASSGGAMVSYGIDIPAVIGTDSAYVGLSAATSGGYGNHDIVSWRFRSPSQVPEPSTLALMAIGLVGAGVAGRRKLAA